MQLGKAYNIDTSTYEATESQGKEFSYYYWKYAGYILRGHYQRSRRALVKFGVCTTSIYKTTLLERSLTSRTMDLSTKAGAIWKGKGEWSLTSPSVVQTSRSLILSMSSVPTSSGASRSLPKRNITSSQLGYSWTRYMYASSLITLCHQRQKLNVRLQSRNWKPLDVTRVVSA